MYPINLSRWLCIYFFKYFFDDFLALFFYDKPSDWIMLSQKPTLPNFYDNE